MATILFSQDRLFRHNFLCYQFKGCKGTDSSCSFF